MARAWRSASKRAMRSAGSATSCPREIAERGFGLRDDVVAYLLRHSRRDMASLVGMLDALDKYSLETGREITLPLLRELSQPLLV